MNGIPVHLRAAAHLYATKYPCVVFGMGKRRDRVVECPAAHGRPWPGFRDGGWAPRTMPSGEGVGSSERNLSMAMVLSVLPSAYWARSSAELYR